MAIIPRFSKYVVLDRSLCDILFIGRAFQINYSLATATMILMMIAIMGTTVPGTTTEDGKMH